MTGFTLPVRPARRAHRLLLQTGTALAAALVLAGVAASAAHAQGFNGTVSSQTNTFVNAAKDDITVFGQEGIINWNATGASAGATNVDFLPAGATVLFHDSAGSSSGSFTVLNRIIPTYFDPASGSTSNIGATISLSGTVNSTISVQDPVTGSFSNVQGGNVWFYSPYGIITNGTSTFNVGSLLLTTSDIDTSSGSLYLSQASGQQIGFLQASQPNSFVRILAGTQINATGDPTLLTNSTYVGVFAPRIEQGGSISSDGATALVAAEAGTVTFNFGLVSGAVSIGTSDPNGIVHTGSTGGPASGGEAQQLALIAIPKNSAMTMLLSGSLGYTPAVSAVVDGSSILLVSGYDTGLAPATLAAGFGNITIDNTTFTNALTAQAAGAINVSSASSGLTEFQNGADLSAGKSILLAVNAGQEIRTIGDLTLQQLLPLQAPDITLTVTGAASSPPPAGLIDVTGTLFAIATASPANAPQPAIGGDALGGAINVAVSAGTLSANKGLVLIANGVGENGTDQGGNGTGGTITVGVENGGTISSSSFNLSASGFAGGSSASAISAGGTGTGGTVSLSDGSIANGFGTLDFVSVNINAQASGGNGVAASGSATGGKIDVTLGNSQTWSSLGANASASNGFGFQTTTILGSASGQANGVTLIVNGAGKTLTLDTLGLYNNVEMDGSSGAAFSGQAGGVSLSVTNTASLLVSGVIAATADATPPGDPSFPSGDFAPSMIGGTVSIIADNGTISANQLTASADAVQFGAGVTAAIARGGSVTLGTRNNATITLTGVVSNTLSSQAYGAIGPAATSPASGFSVAGGTAQVFASDSSISGPGELLVSASGLSGGFDFDGSRAGPGFSAGGGIANIDLQAGTSGTANVNFDTIHVVAQGTGTIEFSSNVVFGPSSYSPIDIAAIQGDGGQGNGGTAQITVAAGTLAATNLRVYANGVGGTSGFAPSATPAWRSGVGAGGSASIVQSGGAVNVTHLEVAATGQGGGYIASGNSGDVLPIAGTGVGGTARISLAAGTMTIAGDVSIFANASGGEGSSTLDPVLNGGNGGSASSSGALAELLMPAGSTATFTSPIITISANALAGIGGSAFISGTGANGAAGNAFAGTARFNLSDGAFTVSSVAEVYADALGSTGSAILNGGTAGFLLTDTLASPATARSLASLLLSSNPSGLSGAHRAGKILLTVKPGTAAASPLIVGDFTATAPGDAAFVSPGTGFIGDIGAFPVSVGGNVLIDTISDVGFTLATGGSFNAGGTLTINGRTITSTGAGVLSATGNVAINASSGIDLAVLKSGGTTLLAAQNPVTLAFGSINVGALTSTGLVTVQSSTFDAGASGPLSFANSFATAGGFTVQTAGNLAVANITATGGAASLTSTGGTFTNSGTVSGTGVTIASSGNATLSGPVTSTAGLSLTSSAGTVTSTSTVSATGNVSVSGNAGINLPSLVSGGTTSLTSLNGAISLPALTSPGGVTLNARSANIASTGALTFANSATTAGDFIVLTGGNLSVAGLTATGGAVDLTSVGGTFSNSGTVSGAQVTILAANGMTLSGPITASAVLSFNSSAGAIVSTSTVSATGNVDINGNTGITLASLNSGGTTGLTSLNGAISIPILRSTGIVTATARSVGVISPGALTFANSSSTAGNFSAQATGNIAVAAITATGGSVSLSSTGGTFANSGAIDGTSVNISGSGNVTVSGPVTSGGLLTLNSSLGILSSTAALTASGNVRAIGGGGVTLSSLDSSGTTLLRSLNGAIQVTSLNSSGAITVNGRSANITSSGSVTFADSVTTAGDFTVAAGSNISVANLSATGGAISLTSDFGTFTNSGTISGAGILISARNNLTLSGPIDSTAGLTLISSNRRITSTSTVAATGAVSVSGDDGITLPSLVSGDTTLLEASAGDISIASLTSTGDVTASAELDVSITSPGALTFASALTDSNLSLTANGGDLVINLAVSSGDMALNSSGDVTGLGDIVAGGTLDVGASGLFQSTFAVTSGGNATIDGSQGINLTRLTSGGTTGLDSASGPITVGNLNSVGVVNASGTAINIGSTGSLRFANAIASTGGISLAIFSDLRIGNAIAAGNLIAQAGNLFSLGGLASASAIVVGSGDISIGATAQLGERGKTNEIALFNTSPANGTRVGGTGGQTGPWALDANEALRLFAENTIDISTEGVAPADLVVGDLAFSFGPAVTSGGSNPNLGSGGRFGIFSGGRIVVTGTVAPTVSGSNDTFALIGQNVDVVSDTGTIALRDSDGTLSGQLRLSGNSLRIATAAALSDVNSDLPLDQISTRLDQNDGIVRDEGTISAGTISVDAQSEFYIQNTGESTLFTARRGFTANSLLIDTETSNLDIAINGVLNGELGPITGIETQRSVMINGEFAAVGGPFNPLSTINGCAIGRDCSISIIEIAPSDPIIDELLKPPSGGGLDAVLVLPIVQFGPPPLIDSPPLIDEPVTGLGNDGLWQQR